MRVLIIHQNFPGQFRHIAQAWAKRPGWQVLGIGRESAPGLKGVQWVRYQLHRAPRPEQHPYLRTMENAVLHGQAVLRALRQLKNKGFVPDAIVAHPGWGETLYVKDVFPKARLIHFCEWYYHAEGADLGFDPEHPLTLDDRARIRTWNALHLLNLENCDAAVSPTYWQRSRHPEIYQSKIQVQHEGIDLDALGPDSKATFTTPSGITFAAGDPVVTYVARNLEPYRGFHVFMRALQRIQRRHQHCHALIVGGDDVSYGARPKGAPNWRERMLREVRLDPKRTHFLGRLPYEQYLSVLQVSAAHVYLTYPFVLSWSLLEALACGVFVVGSNTAPVREVIRQGESGRLVDFFDVDMMADEVVQAIDPPSSVRKLREGARAVARRYGREAALKAYDRLIEAPEAEVDVTARLESVA